MLVGFGVGAVLYLFTHPNVSTGGDAVERPAVPARSFSWPLRLSSRVSVLLIGVDETLNNRRQVVPISRSDTLILVSFDPEHDQVNALWIPRDTRASIPGVGTTKINASYAFGGPGLTSRTVEDLLGVPIHYYVKLGPRSFARIIDALGGLEIDVEKDMNYTDRWAGLSIHLKQGRQLLTGEQAMHYARFRHDVFGDIGRVERQQKVMMALLGKLMSPTAVLSAPQLLRAFAENTQTNLTMTNLITLGVFTARLDHADVHVATLPGRITPIYWEPDVARSRRIVAEMFYGVEAQALASTAIEILNASGIPGLARQTAQRLERLGFRIVRVDNAPSLADATTIIDRTGRPQIARVLAEILGHKRITHEPGVGPDITIVVARDLATRHTSVAANRRR